MSVVQFARVDALVAAVTAFSTTLRTNLPLLSQLTPRMTSPQVSLTARCSSG
jgi:hypothetical protein